MNTQDQWAEYLDPETRPDVRADLANHLDAHQPAALDRVADVLADGAVWGEPGADVKGRLLAEVSRTKGERTADGVSTTDSGRRHRNRSRLALVGGGLVAAAAAIVFFTFVQPGAVDNVSTYEVAGTELTPDLDATVDIEPRSAGVAITLHIAGLPPAPEGSFYAGWLMLDEGMDDEGMGDDSGMGDDGMAESMATQMVGIGSFHWREGGIPIELWSGVETDRYPILVVTLQPEDQPLVPSDQVVMTARVDGSE